MKHLRIGLLGLGQVGSGLYSILMSKGRLLRRQCGVSFSIERIAVKRISKKRAVRPKRSLLTGDAWTVVRDSDIDVVVELIGGIHPAKELILSALRSGKDVVTANKALLAESGRELFGEAKRRGRHIFFEASVGGGIPVIKTIREGLVANRVHSVESIINGTSNYILTRMAEGHLDFKEALALAQKKGYAEANPRFDIEGIDSAHKITILASLLFGGWVSLRDVYCEGISRIRSEDLEFAEEFGYVVKLLAIAKKTSEGIEARVQPSLLPKSHVLAKVDGSTNAVLLRGDEVGEVLLYGPGAGGLPTGSSVVSDLVDLGRIRAEKVDHAWRPELKPLELRNISSLLSRYYLRFHVVDRPGVLAKISHLLGRHRVSISDVIQRERRTGGIVPLIFLTHDTHEHSVRGAIKSIDRLSAIKGKTQLLKIEQSRLNSNGSAQKSSR